MDKGNTDKVKSGSGIAKTELEDMSSFFQKILSNPFNQEKDICNSNDISDEITRNNDFKTTTTSLDVQKSPFSTNYKISNDSIEKEKLNVQTEPRTDISICENETNTNYFPTTGESPIGVSCISNEESQQNCPRYVPSIPSPSRYGAIEALDEGDEHREQEKWAERTETITRLEHERYAQ